MLGGTYTVRVGCPNCYSESPVEIPKGTRIHSHEVRCHNCGLLLRLTRSRGNMGSILSEERWYDFLRDFFGLRKSQ